MGNDSDDPIGSIVSGSQANSDLYSNVGQSYVQTTEDKLKICLTEHSDFLETKSMWQTSTSIVVSISLVLCTADFKDAFGLGKDVWHAFFMIVLVLSVIWLLYTLKKKPWVHKSVDEIIATIKGTPKV